MLSCKSQRPHSSGDGRAGLYRLRKNSSGQARRATTACAGAARFGVRSRVAGPLSPPRASSRGLQPRASLPASKLPHSKAPLRMTAETSFSAACLAPEATQFQGLKSLCENSWIPAFAGMTGRNTAPKSSAVTPAEAGVQAGQCETRVFTQTLKAHSTPRPGAAGLKPRPSKGHKQYRLLMQLSTRPRY